ncbi:hypothetical protein L226DRAFT_54169 [Lentinus tigrinus ALCF2SS1-7]|uniref:uncharacterized protein n=1 Tax=Lentinus tigrinus ALCF2SS1-7 TaxID=1328758 RepID=UPI0011663396|nr:hypothetical protein L226DRAFT_54169 [Lentinus tigrinus ALCF2SS1-7]
MGVAARQLQPAAARYSRGGWTPFAEGRAPSVTAPCGGSFRASVLRAPSSSCVTAIPHWGQLQSTYTPALAELAAVTPGPGNAADTPVTPAPYLARWRQPHHDIRATENKSLAVSTVDMSGHRPTSITAIPCTTPGPPYCVHCCLRRASHPHLLERPGPPISLPRCAHRVAHPGLEGLTTTPRPLDSLDPILLGYPLARRHLNPVHAYCNYATS